MSEDWNEIGSPFELRVRQGFDHEFPKKRDYAYTYEDKGDLIIVFSPKMLRAEEDRIRALMRHEMAHALFIHQGNHHHSEQETDDLAEKTWGDRISYDHDDIQTLKRGKYPRPTYLPR